MPLQAVEATAQSVATRCGRPGTAPYSARMEAASPPPSNSLAQRGGPACRPPPARADRLCALARQHQLEALLPALGARADRLGNPVGAAAIQHRMGRQPQGGDCREAGEGAAVESAGRPAHAARPSRGGYEINIDKKGVQITRSPAASAAASAAGPAGAASAGAPSTPQARSSRDPAPPLPPRRRRPLEEGIRIQIPPGAETEEVRPCDRGSAGRDQEAIREGELARAAASAGFILGDHLPQFTVLLIVLSIVTKIMAARPLQGRGEGRRRDRDRRVRSAQAPGRRSAHGGDAGAGRAALPVQHAGLDRPPDRDRPEAREPDAEEPDRAAARLDAGDARGHRARTTSAARWR